MNDEISAVGIVVSLLIIIMIAFSFTFIKNTHIQQKEFCLTMNDYYNKSFPHVEFSNNGKRLYIECNNKSYYATEISICIKYNKFDECTFRKDVWVPDE